MKKIILSNLKKLINTRRSQCYMIADFKDQKIITDGCIAVIIDQKTCSEFEKSTKVQKRELHPQFWNMFRQSDDSRKIKKIEYKDNSDTPAVFFENETGYKTKINKLYFDILAENCELYQYFHNSRAPIEVMENKELKAVIMPMKIL